MYDMSIFVFVRRTCKLSVGTYRLCCLFSWLLLCLYFLLPGTKTRYCTTLRAQVSVAAESEPRFIVAGGWAA
jgi:hypothetical protein